MSFGSIVTWLMGVVAGSCVATGIVVTLQQEPLPEGASETCVFACCLACSIIGQCSPPQWPAIASFALQFATAKKEGPNSTIASNAATNLVKCFTTSHRSYYYPVTPASDLSHPWVETITRLGIKKCN